MKRKKTSIMKKFLIIAVVCIMFGAVLFFGLNKFSSKYNKTTKIGFEDIGELATQSAYCTEVNSTDASRKLFNVKIPFTESTNIYSYNITIKAGLNFSDIKWTLDDDKKEINIELPEVKILSGEIEPNSFKMYYESESIFRPITLEENNDALKSMKEKAEKDAVDNGLLDNAKSNAETILKSFFSKAYDLNVYHINFK